MRMPTITNVPSGVSYKDLYGPDQKPSYMDYSSPTGIMKPDGSGINDLALSSIPNQQQEFAKALLAQMQGNSPFPNVAGNLLNQAAAQNLQQNASMLASAKGVNPAMAAQIASQNAAQAGQKVAGQAATLQAQQQADAQRMYQNQLGQMAQTNLGQQGVDVKRQEMQNQLNGQIINAGGYIATKAAGFSQGGRVPGQAKINGDSYSNDTVPTMLSPGEIVIPRSAATSEEKAKQFIEDLMRHHKRKNTTFADVIQAHKSMRKYEGR